MGFRLYPCFFGMGLKGFTVLMVICFVKPLPPAYEKEKKQLSYWWTYFSLNAPKNFNFALVAWMILNYKNLNGAKKKLLSTRYIYTTVNNVSIFFYSKKRYIFFWELNNSPDAWIYLCRLWQLHLHDGWVCFLFIINCHLELYVSFTCKVMLLFLSRIYYTPI